MKWTWAALVLGFFELTLAWDAPDICEQLQCIYYTDIGSACRAVWGKPERTVS